MCVCEQSGVLKIERKKQREETFMYTLIQIELFSHVK